MAWPPTALTLHAVATSTYLNSAFADGGTATTAAQTAANTANTSIAAASASLSVGALVKWGASGITLPANSVSRSVIQEFNAYASSPISSTVNYRGANYTDRITGSPTARFLANGATTHNAPAATKERWDVVSMNIVTAGISNLLGVEAAIGSAAVPVPATAADWVLYYVYNKAGQTGVANANDGTNGFIVNVSMHNFGGGTGGGGGGGTITNAIVGVGTGTATNIIPILSGAQTGTINSVDFSAVDASGMNSNKGFGAIRSDGANSGSAADLFRDFVPARAVPRIFASTANVSVVASTSIPVALMAGGRLRTNTATVSTAASGPAGTRYVVADLGTAAGWTLVSPMPDTLSLGQYQTLLGTVWWDATNIRTDTFYDYSPLATINSHQVTPNLLPVPLPGVATTADTLNTTGDVLLAGMSGTLVLPKASRIKITGYIKFSGVGVPGSYAVTFTPYVDALQPVYEMYRQQTNGLADTLSFSLPHISLGAGIHTVAMYGRVSSVSASFSTFANGKFLEVEVKN